MDKQKMDQVREAHAKQLESNGHILATNRLEGDDTAAFYCGQCGHGFAIKFSDGDDLELIGKDFEAACDTSQTHVVQVVEDQEKHKITLDKPAKGVQ